MTAEKLTICEDLRALSSVLRSGILSPSSRDAVTTDEAAAIITELVEVMGELLRHPMRSETRRKAQAALAKVRTPHHPDEGVKL